MAGSADGSDEARVVRDALRTLGHADAYDVPVAPWLCAEPVVVACGAWERESRQADGSVRWRRGLVVHVCREGRDAVGADARAIAGQMAGLAWSKVDAGGGLRVVACDVGRPSPEGRDSSGRWLWAVPVTLTVVVNDG